MSTNKKAALVTGGAKRIGAHICKALAGVGYDLIIHYNTSFEEAEDLAKSIESTYNIEVYTISKDLLKINSCRDLIQFSLEKFPHLSTLINNASIFLPDDLMTSEEQNFLDHYNIHVKVPFFLSRELIKQQTDCKLHIINIIDEFVQKKTAVKYFSYLLSKKALHLLTEMIQEYVSIHNLNTQVSGIYPGKILSQHCTGQNT